MPARALSPDEASPEARAILAVRPDVRSKESKKSLSLMKGGTELF